MDLALRVGELLLASGQSTESVSEAMRSLTVAYGLPRTEAQVTFTGISLSVQPDDAPPITGERLIRRRYPDYARLFAVHKLVEEAALGLLELDEAARRLSAITRSRPVYPRWLVRASLGSVATSASLLVGGGLLVAVAAFVATILGDMLANRLASRGIAEFYQVALAAAVSAAVASLLLVSGANVATAAMVTGGIMTLLPGRPLVAAIQDGITTDLVSSAARLLEVFFNVAAIVAGIGLSVFVSVRLGVPLDVADLPTIPASLHPVQLLSAAGIAASFAVSLIAPRSVVGMAAVGGVLIWISYVLLTWADVPEIMAAALSAGLIGLLAHGHGRRRMVPALPYIVPAISPLLPGTPLYRGLLEITQGDLDGGVLSLVQAISIALALGAGVNLGGELVRAFSRGGQPGAGPGRRPAARRTRGF
ncbi:MAG: threonine/serine exporter family protein [Streptosporangiales bacterium]|nr:threonine/serine exporter family protein [Streptosporangiales bacterium]